MSASTSPHEPPRAPTQATVPSENKSAGNWSSFLVSVTVHGIVLASLLFLKSAIEQKSVPISMESVFEEEPRTVEDIQQTLDTQDTPATELNAVAGGMVSVQAIPNAFGGEGGTGISGDGSGGGRGGLGGGTGVGRGIEAATRGVEVKVSLGEGGLPGSGMIGNDLGAGEVGGEIGAVVEGYGGALDRMTQELIRMMRSEKLLVVWMFDESESMKDDQQDLKTRFQRVYEELKLVDKDATILAEHRRKSKDKPQDVLLTAITSFGEKYHIHTPKPTTEPAQIVAAIDKIPIDKTGAENTCAALEQTLKQYAPMARNGRKLVLIVISDESGDDWDRVEDVRQQAISARAPIYVMGRESVFGSLYAHVRWIQPVSGVLHYLPIRRGPETPFAEQLQWDGFRRRRDAQLSGFGPYEQVRLCRDTGGVFFQLPNEETDINDLDNRKLEALGNRVYLPSLDSRREYAADRDHSPFRKAIWDVILMLNPYDERFKQMEIPDEEYFSVNWNESSANVVKRLQQISNMIVAINGAQTYLEKVKPLRDKEPSHRWRANFDLIYAQLYAYKVRLYEYGLALHQYGKTMPQRIKNPQSNAWSIRTYAPGLIYPDAEQTKLMKITKKDVDADNERALALLKDVVAQHPGTPWARRAEYELSRQFGASFNEHHFVPQPPPNPPPPPPPPPPKL